MTHNELARLHSEVEHALEAASQMHLELVVYILTMAKLELENELGERKLQSLVRLKEVVSLQ